MIGRLSDVSRRMNGEWVVSFTATTDPRRELEGLQETELDIKATKHRNKRSLDANAYFHVLVNKIAEKTNESDTAVKKRLVQEYGTLARDEEDNVVGIKLPISVDVDKLIEYTRWFDRRTEGGHVFNCYLVMKPTHEMNTAEMARVIDGTVSEAKELGIETMTPAEIKAMMERYERGR